MIRESEWSNYANWIWQWYDKTHCGNTQPRLYSTQCECLYYFIFLLLVIEIDCSDLTEESDLLCSVRVWRISLTHNRSCGKEFQCVHFKGWGCWAEITYHQSIIVARHKKSYRFHVSVVSRDKGLQSRVMNYSCKVIWSC